jgi:hypothetical protein
VNEKIREAALPMTIDSFKSILKEAAQQVFANGLGKVSNVNWQSVLKLPS